MELKSIKLVGFKSFADSTTISIRSNLTAIVGPNGCGKSNVVDAVRWVIGEMSAKQLRGQSMSDVIFNGTNQRKPVGKAAVELLFDNSDGRIGGEFAGYGEINVRREVERDGQSSYYLNGSACRRRDILGVFLGTGLGSRSYAIIEQGMISRLIEAKPEEMRTHLEEAAGISRYKEKRRDTENRIKRTQENLDRVNDIREELATQCRRLKRQANAAERYKVLKAEETLLSAQIKALQWQNLDEKYSKQLAAVNNHQTQFEEKLARQRHVEADIEKARVVEAEHRDVVAAVQKKYYLHAADIARIEQQIKTTEEQTAGWETELEEAEQLCTDLSSHSIDHESQIKHLKSELDNMGPKALEIQAVAKQGAAQLEVAESAMQSWQADWDVFQSSSAETSKQHEVAKATLSHLKSQQQDLASRLQHLEGSQNLTQVQELATELEPLGLSVQSAKDELAEAQSQLDALSKSINNQRDLNQHARQELNRAQQELHQHEARLTSLETMQQAALSDTVTEDWLKQQNLEHAQRLGGDLKVEDGWELAVETVLGPQIEAVCVDSTLALHAPLTSLSQGKLTFIDASAVCMNETQGGAALLIDKVRSSWALDTWLGSVFCAESWDHALSLQPTLKANESVITQDGLWLGPNWLRVAKTATSEDSIILRKHQIDELQQSLPLLQEAMNQQAHVLEEGENKLSSLESEREQMHTQFSIKSNVLSETQSELSAKQSRYNEIDQQQSRITIELNSTRSQLQDVDQKYIETDAAITSTQDLLQQIDSRRAELLEQQVIVRSQLSDARTQAQQSQQRADEIGIRVSANEDQLQLLQQTVATAQRQLNQIEERRDQLVLNLSESGSPLELLQTQLQNELSQHIEVEGKLKDVEAQLKEAEQVVVAQSDERERLIKAVSDYKDEVQSLNMKAQEIKVRQDTIVEQLASTDFELSALIEGLSSDASLPVWQESYETITKRISRLGPINLGAIEEFETLSERKVYLDQQYADLEEALVTLDSAIKKIDRETRTRFKETFDKVSAGFTRLFPKIFGGGRAYLELEENDLLTSGVVVKAQPPGKRNASIHMLSGGEKALTAIALVFAMFQLNPAPFCILDEVDAPLDDVNVGRYVNLVKEMADTTQFIVISHNKVTIALANQLMGVTMHEAGVSRMVAVDIEEAIEMTEV